MDRNNMKFRTEKKAWLWFAEQWDDATTIKRKTFVLVSGTKCYGICDCLDLLYYLASGYSITRPIYKKMFERLKKEIPDYWTGYLFPRTKNGAKKRAELCRKLAGQCK
jgi:hypothetical protein